MTREEQVAYFREHGYLAVEDVFSADEIDRLRANLEALEHRTHALAESTDRVKLTLFGGGVEDRAIQQIAEPHELDGAWMDLAADPRILDLVEVLIGPNILLYYSMLMMKPARSRRAGAVAPGPRLLRPRSGATRRLPGVPRRLDRRQRMRSRRARQSPAGLVQPLRR